MLCRYYNLPIQLTDFTVMSIFCSNYLFSVIRCVNEDCKRKKGQESPKTICKVEDLHEDSRIISVHTLEYKQRERCIFNETYGFYVKLIWISGRCKGDFEVCFRKGNVKIVSKYGKNR